jgi:hypothetical protein
VIDVIRDSKKTAGDRRLLELREYLEFSRDALKSGKLFPSMLDYRQMKELKEKPEIQDQP